MNQFIKLCYIILIISTTTSCKQSEIKTKEIDYYRIKLEERLLHTFCLEIKIPEIEFSDQIVSNAQFNGEKILVGKRFFSDDYFTDEDRLSILFHECMHSLNENLSIFQCIKDEKGNILEIKTNKIYKKYLSETEFQKDILEMQKNGITDHEIQAIKEYAKTPVFLRFIYAPSNLSKDEILCYFSEQSAAKRGVFTHSKFYKSLILSRIDAEKSHLKRRLNYEKENRLNSKGEKLLQ